MSKFSLESLAKSEIFNYIGRSKDKGRIRGEKSIEIQ